MKLIRHVDTKIVSYMFANSAEISLGNMLVADGVKVLDITSDTHEIVTGVAAPALFVGGALTFDVEWHVIDQAAIDSAAAKIEMDLAALKAAKNLLINEWRAQANGASFVFGGKHIAADDLSTKDILVANAKILNHGALPADWLGKWKAIDNTFVDILSIAKWHEFIDAMYNQGQTNFIHAQQLKEALKLATTADQITAITW